MKTADKLKKLDEYIGQEVKGPEEIKARWKNYFISGIDVIIETDNGELKTPIANLIEFLNQRTIIHLPVLKNENNAIIISAVLPPETVKSVAEILLDNIKKVQGDPGYVKQATAITQSVSALINLAKTELSIRRAKSEE